MVPRTILDALRAEHSQLANAAGAATAARSGKLQGVPASGQAGPEEVSTDCVLQAGRKESPNSDQAADGRDHQWWHPERIAEEKEVRLV
jgi:hypothetical protein